MHRIIPTMARMREQLPMLLAIMDSYSLDCTSLRDSDRVLGGMQAK